MAVGLDDERPGLLVRAVDEDGPAGAAGVSEGDLLVAVGDTALSSVDDLAAAQADAVLIAAKVLDPKEARSKRGLDPATTPTAPKVVSPRREIWLSMRANKGAMAGLVVIVLLILIAFPSITLFVPHWFGYR